MNTNPRSEKPDGSRKVRHSAPADIAPAPVAPPQEDILRSLGIPASWFGEVTETWPENRTIDKEQIQPYQDILYRQPIGHALSRCSDGANRAAAFLWLVHDWFEAQATGDNESHEISRRGAVVLHAIAEIEAIATVLSEMEFQMGKR